MTENATSPNRPRRLTLASICKALGWEPDGLTRYIELGIEPEPVQNAMPLRRAPCSDAVLNDQRLRPEQKQALIATYEAFVDGR